MDFQIKVAEDVDIYRAWQCSTQVGGVCAELGFLNPKCNSNFDYFFITISDRCKLEYV